MDKEPRRSYLPYDPEFEVPLSKALRDAAQIHGKLTNRGNVGNGVERIDYHQTNTPLNKRREGWETSFHFSAEEAENGQHIHATTRFISAINQANLLQKYISENELPAPQLGNILHHTLRVLPDLYLLHEGMYTNAHTAPIVNAAVRENTHSVIRQYVQYDPATARTFIEGFAHHLSQTAPMSPHIQKYTELLLKRLQATVAEDRRNPDNVSTYKSHFTFVGPHVEQNIAQAIAAFDSVQLVPPEFWQAILNAPLASQSYLVTTLLADKLQSPDAPAIIGNIKSYDRLNTIEHVTNALLQRARRHSARDQKNLQTIREAVAADLKNRADKVSIGKAVKLADMIIRREYPHQLSGLRPEDTFADAAQAVSFLMRITIRPDASEKEKNLANQEAETYLDIIKALAEYNQKPTIRTIGDLALRYAGASGKELEALQQAFMTGGTPRSDGLRNKQWRGERRHNLTKPGYGTIS